MSLRLTRIYRFVASHRLYIPQLTEAQNDELYGKCNNPYGHGHDYVLHVSVAGTSGQETGRLVSLGALDRFVRKQVLDVFDGKDMNSDVPGFEGVPTTENLARNIANLLRVGWVDAFPQTRLAQILIEETPRNTFVLKLT